MSTQHNHEELPEFSNLLHAFFHKYSEIKLNGFAKRAGVRRETIWRIMQGSEPTKTTKYKLLTAMQYYWRDNA